MPITDLYLFFRLPDGRLRYKCDICFKLLNSNKSVYHHKAVYHGGGEENPEYMLCSYPGCKYSTHLKMNMNNHVSRQHTEKRHICDQCGEKFIGPRELKIHYIKVHKNEEHICDLCGKMFTNPLSLKNHKKVHGEANLQCQICGKSFVRRNNLNTHTKFAHSEFKPFFCLCGKKFKTKAHIRRHWLTSGHTKGKRFNEENECTEDLDVDVNNCKKHE